MTYARADAAEALTFEWGTLHWIVGAPQGNSETMTFGRCVIRAGMANPRHYHPNCDEILHLLSGELEHSLDHQIVTMRPGDTITIPLGVVHNARAVGGTDAEMVIAFNSAYREFVAVED